MEYCGGGDLSSVIKQSQKQGRPIPEDAIWNYFMQILLALHHCHHPNGHGRSASSGGLNGGLGLDCKEKRSQILHRDLKPDNGNFFLPIVPVSHKQSQVFLDDNNRVKLGDFGLSKALAQASFANTYVGVGYSTSPKPHH
jgi:NIMA (never in mitosis gene a)-related kinase 2